jgi:murein hydrolase activator
MRLLLFILLVVAGIPAGAQKNIQKNLQNDRALIEKQLVVLNKKIAQANNDIHASAQQRSRLQEQITNRRQQIASINQQLTEIKTNLQKTDAGLGNLLQQLTNLKKSYAATLALSWKLMNESREVPVLFAANANNEVQRGQYIRIFRELQLKQVAEIRQLQQEYDLRKQKLGNTQRGAINQLQQNRIVSAQLLGKEQLLVTIEQQLANRKSKLQQIANRRKNQQAAIEKKLRNLVVTLPPKKIPVKKETTITGRSPGGNPVITSKIPVKENSRFRLNKGSLNCPVEGSVYMRFGRVTMGNNGPVFDNSFLTLHTSSPGASVAAVFEGTITSVLADDNTYVVLIKHGEQYTVYGNLAAVTVRKGQIISTGTIIGHVARGMDSMEGELEFGIYENNRLVNPEPWLNCH